MKEDTEVNQDPETENTDMPVVPQNDGGNDNGGSSHMKPVSLDVIPKGETA